MPLILLIPILLAPLYAEGLIYILKKYFRADLTQQEKLIFYEPTIKLHTR